MFRDNKLEGSMTLRILPRGGFLFEERQMMRAYLSKSAGA